MLINKKKKMKMYDFFIDDADAMQKIVIVPLGPIVLAVPAPRISEPYTRDATIIIIKSLFANGRGMDLDIFSAPSMRIRK